MKKNYNVVQCILENNGGILTSWIPEKYAKVGKYVRLYHNGKWHDGWKVTEVGDKKLQSKDMTTNSRIGDKRKCYDNNIYR